MNVKKLLNITCLKILESKFATQSFLMEIHLKSRNKQRLTIMSKFMNLLLQDWNISTS